MKVSLPIFSLYDKAKFQLQYIDYSENEWTVPLLLTEERAAKFLEDLSVKKVKIIFEDQEWELDVV